MNIPANDFRRQWTELRGDILHAVERTGQSGWYILGSEVSAFEAALAEYWAIPHAVGVASGLDALEIGLRLLGCGTGDKVLTTPLSAFATTLAIVRLGAIPIFVDCDEFGLISLDACEDALRSDPGIRFFVPVHLYGHALDLDRVAQLRDRYDLKIVEDCAQSIGATWKGRQTGSEGHVAATSFYPTKNLGAMGDGGALLMRDGELARRARELRDYGQSAKYVHSEIGYNSRLDELQAAILRWAMLPRLTGWLTRRREIAASYLSGIANPHVRAMGSPAGCESAWHLFPLLTRPEATARFSGFLRENGVMSGAHYPLSIPDQPALHCALGADELRVTRRLCSSETSIPIHPFLRDEEVAAVIDVVNRWEG